tara:strand:+ start:72116 stop:72256 length:141 start_codon:yes stop_codon:yes gene_type:complete
VAPTPQANHRHGDDDIVVVMVMMIVATNSFATAKARRLQIEAALIR